MTLFRKSLIPWYVHGIVYTACLLLSMYHMVLALPDYVFIKVIIAFLLRTQLGVGKYWVWGLFMLSNLPLFSATLDAKLSPTAYLATTSTLF